MRHCDLRMKHIPSGIGNLAVQEFKQIIFVRRQGLWSNAGLEFLHIAFCSELVQSTQNWVIKWLNFFEHLLPSDGCFWWLWYPKWQLGNDIHCFKIWVLQKQMWWMQVHYQLKFDMPPAGYSFINYDMTGGKKSYSFWEVGWCFKWTPLLRLLL